MTTDNLTVFGTDYTGVTGIKAKGTGNGMLTYIRPTGTKSISANGTGIDVAAYSLVDVAVSGGGDSYRLDNIVPEQTVACTTYVQNNSYYGFLTYSSPIDDAEQYLVTFDGTEYVCEGYVPDTNATGVGDLRVTQTTGAVYLITPFYIGYQTGNMALFVSGSGTHTVKVDKLTFIDDGETFTTKTITQNGTYNASSDNADGYSSVTVNVSGGGSPTLQSKTATPTTSQQVIQPDNGYDGLSQVTVNAIPSQYIVPSGNKAITANGTGIDVAEYATVSVNVSGSSKNVQVAQSTTRVANTAYTKAASLTCSVSGKYDVYWDCFRSTTSGTSGSQLYIGGSAYGSANTTFSSNIHAQSNHLTNVQINANQEVAVYVRSRATNYYAYCGQLTIVQTA